MEKPPQQETLSFDGVVRELHGLMARVQAEGAVDSEMDELRKLMLKLQNGELAPKDVLFQARSLAESRQNYH